MRYNIHLWQLDETGHWTAYAVGRKPDGSVTNERDTEATNPLLTLIDAQFGFGIPTADTARWAISVFNGIVRGHLPTAETRKTINESGGINIDAALSLLNPTPPIQGGDTIAEGMGGCFISALLSYPRFITPNGEIEIGGVDYLDLWQGNKPLPHVHFTTPEEILAEERRKRGGFDETVAAFCDTVRWIGEATRTSKAARCAIGKINALVRTFASLGFADILRIDELANEAAEALQAMCEELAERKDAQRNAPVTPEPTTVVAANTKPQKNKGGKHTTRPKRKSEYGKTAQSVADDFNKSKFVPEHGTKPMGVCTKTQIKQWDLKYPDAEHPHPRWGYYADLRLRADLKSEYGEVLQNWARYWADYKVAFKEWRKAHPASRRESFRFTPMKKANGYNPEWIGRDENGTIYNAPTK